MTRMMTVIMTMMITMMMIEGDMWSDVLEHVGLWCRDASPDLC